MLNKVKDLPSQARLRHLFIYDPRTGGLINRVQRNYRLSGVRAGTLDAKGYRRASVDGQVYAEHRLIWVHQYGSVPEGYVIDHINGNKSDNRLKNLRLATVSENNLNKSSAVKNQTGYRGVYRTRQGRYEAQIRRNGVKRYLGTFACPKEASEIFQKESILEKVLPFNKYDLSRPIDVYDNEIFSGKVACIDELAKKLDEQLFERRSKKRLRCLWLILRDLAVNYVQSEEQYLGISLNANNFSKGKRLKLIGFSYRPFRAVIAALQEKYLDYVVGFVDRNTNISRNTRIKANQLLIDEFKSMAIYEHIDVIYPAQPLRSSVILRNHQKVSISLPKGNDEIKSIVEEVNAYNSALQSADIDITLLDYVPPKNEVVRLDLTRKYVQRIFNNASLSFGGRLYGSWWSDCLSELRSRIVINKHPTTEVDIKSLYPILIYAMEGIDYMKDVSDDPYQIDDLEILFNRYMDEAEKRLYRNYFKSMFMMLINNVDEQEAKSALQRAVNLTNGSLLKAGRPPKYPVALDAYQKELIWNKFKERHGSISQYFAGSDNPEASCGRLMRIDSDFIMKVIQHLLKHNVVGLTVHDSVIVPAYALDLTIKVIRQSFIECLKDAGIKVVEPVLDVDNFYKLVQHCSKSTHIEDRELLKRSYSFSRTRRQSYLYCLPS